MLFLKTTLWAEVRLALPGLIQVSVVDFRSRKEGMWKVPQLGGMEFKHGSTPASRDAIGVLELGIQMKSELE